jgi:hypothetical protein
VLRVDEDRVLGAAAASLGAVVVGEMEYLAPRPSVKIEYSGPRLQPPPVVKMECLLRASVTGENTILRATVAGDNGIPGATVPVKMEYSGCVRGSPTSPWLRWVGFTPSHVNPGAPVHYKPAAAPAAGVCHFNRLPPKVLANILNFYHSWPSSARNSCAS